MNRMKKTTRSLTGITVFISMLLALQAQVVNAQATVKAQVNSIRKEYLKINAELKTYKKVEVRWDPCGKCENQPHCAFQNYTGYINASNRVALLKFGGGEEGYWSESEYYYKNEKIIFIYIHSGTPEGNEKQERIYFTNGRIIQALIKTKTAEEEKNINDLENKTDDSIMSNVDESTKTYVTGAETELKQFYEALNK